MKNDLKIIYFSIILIENLTLRFLQPNSINCKVANLGRMNGRLISKEVEPTSVEDLNMFVVPIHFSGGRNYILKYSIGIFLFSQFWPIDILIVESCDWYH